VLNYPALETERLLLLPLSLDDVPGIQQHFANWDVIQHLSARVPWPYPEDGALTFVRDMALPAIARGDQMVWALRLKSAPDATVGVIKYESRDSGYGNRGFWLALHLHGQGYMTEAVSAFQDFVFGELGLESFFVLNAVDNPASRRIKEKTGAEFVGETESLHRNGTLRSERWVVTRQAWRKLRQGESQKSSEVP
jgi:ribosomal-protein-alanine N-acetyltransferase